MISAGTFSSPMVLPHCTQLPPSTSQRPYCPGQLHQDGKPFTLEVIGFSVHNEAMIREILDDPEDLRQVLQCNEVALKKLLPEYDIDTLWIILIEEARLVSEFHQNTTEETLRIARKCIEKYQPEPPKDSTEKYQPEPLKDSTEKYQPEPLKDSTEKYQPEPPKDSSEKYLLKPPINSPGKYQAEPPIGSPKKYHPESPEDSPLMYHPESSIDSPEKYHSESPIYSPEKYHPKLLKRSPDAKKESPVQVNKNGVPEPKKSPAKLVLLSHPGLAHTPLLETEIQDKLSISKNLSPSSK